MKYRSYRSIAQLNRDVVDWTVRLPRDLDVIVGIPRSGLLVANLLALHLDLPMTDPDGLAAGRLMRTGRHRGARGDAALLEGRCNVLVVDDSVTSGSQLGKTRQAIGAARLRHRIRYGAVYISPAAHERGDVDYHAEIIPLPRSFEWNILHTPGLRNTCVALEGVLCSETDGNGSGAGFADAVTLRAARPLYLPSHEIGWLVTCRAEEHRPLTEEWLREHGVRYRELVMLPAGDAAHPIACAAEKAAVYVRTGARKFIEASPGSAAEIARLAGRPVFCMQSREMAYPEGAARPVYTPTGDHHAVSRAVHRARRATRSFLRRLRDRMPFGE